MGHYLVMGAQGGIGESLARRLHAQGHSLTLTSRDRQKLQNLQAELSANLAICDVTDTASLDAALDSAMVSAGDAGLAGLAYCIGTLNLKPLRATLDSEILDAFQINTLSAIHAIRRCAESLKKAHGSVVLFSSIAVAHGFANHIAISTAKGAIEGATRALAAELAPSVRVNAIAPGLTETNLTSSLTENANMAKALAAMHPMGRLGSVEDMAALSAFLLSADSGWITGQIIAVDGGRSSVRSKG